jgi:tol-pal system protein YbgF
LKFLRLTALTLAFSPFCFAVNKDMIAMQRDLEAKIDAMQQSINSRLDTLSGLLQGIQNDSRRTADQVAGMQDVLRNSVTSALAPVTGLNTKIDSQGEDVRALRDAMADLGARLERMDAKITDLKNQLQIMQNPPAAPGAAVPGTATPGTTVPGATGVPGTVPQGSPQLGMTGPPAGMSADKTYTDARRDQQTGNIELAMQEYQQYLTYFPTTELAANAQYYVGEISYNKGDYKGAIKAFDAVLERYPQNPKTRDARLMKGLALAKDGQRSRAVQELRSLIQTYPASEQARRAQAALKDPTLFPSVGATARRRP